MNTARRWRPAPLLYATAAVHAGAVVATLVRSQSWPWALGALAVNHGVLAAAGLWPRSALLGPNWRRLPAQNGVHRVAITIDDGPDPQVTPRVLEILAAHGARATFFCIGEHVRRWPQIARAILAAGHEIENHSEHHRLDFSLLGPKRMREEIEQAQRTISDTVGVAPLFFRAPAGLRNPFLDPILAGLQLNLASWTRRGFDTLNSRTDDVLRRLINSLGDGDILLLHDHHCALTANGNPVILEVLPRLLETLSQKRLGTVTLRSAL